ncbi:MAG: VanZ family protein [Betaproteobacteria bacterium]
MPPPPTRLPRHLALAYVALIIYASLHPFSGWRDTGLSPWAFLDAGWPHYWTFFDLAINTFAYLPLGFLLTLTLRRLPGWCTGALTALLLGAGISFCLESLQTWLPSRVPSNLDLASNSLGTLIGVLLACWHGERTFRRIMAIQHNLLAPFPHAELGLVLISLWLLTQLSPETVLFGTGDLRQLLEIAPTLPYAPPSFFAIETGIIACHTVAIGLIAVTLLAAKYSPSLVLGVFFAFALSIRTLAAAILVDPLQALAWLTPGAGLGLMIGGAALVMVFLLPVSLRLPLAGLALMAGTVLVNLAPPNPYSIIALAAWRQGHLLNFNGLTRLTASFWPFLALPYLTLCGRRAP